MHWCLLRLVCGYKMILSFNHPVRVMWYLCFLGFLAATSSSGKPRLHCDAPAYDFGTRISGGSITNEFILTNKGSEPIKISKIKDCCGVKSSVPSLEIAPGSKITCKSIFTTRNRYGKQNKQILVATNDRKKPYYELKMVGTLLRPVEFKPRFIKLNNQLSDATVDYTITATNILKKTITLDSVASTIPGIHAEVVGDHARNWVIQLSSSGSLPVGKLSGRILLNYSSGTITVPVFGAVKPIIQVAPDRIQLSSRSSTPVKRMVMLRSDRPFSISETKLENASGSVELKELSDGKHQLSLSIDPSSVKQEAKLVVETSCPSRPIIEIPVLGI